MRPGSAPFLRLRAGEPIERKLDGATIQTVSRVRNRTGATATEAKASRSAAKRPLAAAYLNAQAS